MTPATITKLKQKHQMQPFVLELLKEIELLNATISLLQSELDKTRVRQ